MNGVRTYEPIDWRQIVLELRTQLYGRGFRRKYLALGIADNTINRLATGDINEPRYTVGVRLLEWHAQIVSKNQLRIPFAIKR